MSYSEFDHVFEQTCPPASDTIHSIESACPFAGEASNLDTCVYQPICRSAEPALHVLRKVYTPQIRVTLSEASSSIVVRSEHHFSGDQRRRLSLRKHIYELRGAGGEGQNSSAGGSCPIAVSNCGLGRYLGFIDLRPNSQQAPLAMGLLVPPRNLRHDPNTFIATGEYGPIFGAHGFACTVYSMHEPDTGGADCAQACAVMVLASLADRGVQLTGPYSLTYLAKRSPPSVTECETCIALTHESQPVASFRIDGLFPEDMERVFQQCGASSCHAWFSDNHVQDALFERLLEAYLLARCPVVLFIDFDVWCKMNKLTIRGGVEHSEVAPHALCAVGFTKSIASQGSLLASLILHDPGFRPYYKRALGTCLKAMKAYNGSVMHAVFSCDRKITLHAPACIRFLMDSPSDRAWFRPYFERLDRRDYHIRLAHRDDLGSTFLPSENAESSARGTDQRRFTAARTKLVKGAATLPRSWYWCVSGLNREGGLDTLWMFNANATGTEANWTARLDVTGEGELSTNRPTPLRVPSSPRGKRPAVAQDRDGSTSLVQPVSRVANLRCSLLTSSSDLPLETLLSSVKSISNSTLFDVLMLRDQDVREIERQTPLDPPITGSVDARSITSILAIDSNRELIQNWLVDQFKRVPNVRVAALATYFPDISSVYADRQQAAMRALCNTVRIAMTLNRKGIMETPIVEIVSGNRLDKCECRSCAGNRIWEYGATDKITRLIKSLRSVCDSLKQETSEAFGLAIELEPGETYVVKDGESLRELCDQIMHVMEDNAWYIGINLDLAHMRAAGVAPDVVGDLTDMIMHAHVCDLPFRMHTKDQAVGRWSPIDIAQSDYAAYFRTLGECTVRPQGTGQRLFSRAVAVELEGCNRAAWIHESIAMLQMFGVGKRPPAP